jgi:cytochrome c5
MRRGIRFGIKLRSATVAVLCLVLCGLVWLISLRGRVVQAQGAPQGSAEKPAQKDDYQRSTEIFGYRTMAKSGPKRGEELYYFKCWICHNQFLKTGPQLKDLFKRQTFSTSGDPVNDQTVTDKILKGGPGMPAFGTTLKQADIADLLSYIKEGCCFDSENPPPNPRYLAGR